MSHCLLLVENLIGMYLVHGWMHLFMVQVDYRLFGIGWCIVDALLYGTD
jgi:hypothetical protein